MTPHADSHRRALAVCLVWLVMLCQARGADADVIDSFDDAGAWQVIPADGVRGEIVEEDGALRLDYDFSAGAGYCVLRRTVELPLDPNYRFGLRYRGEGPPNSLEFKLVDESGENVWWSVARDQVFPEAWSWRTMRRRHFSFAWGPSGGEPLGRVGAIEIAVTASSGGRGSLWLDELVYEALPEQEPRPVEPEAIGPDGAGLGRVSADGSFDWSASEGDTLTLRFDAPVEFSAIELVWETVPETYRIDISRDGEDYESAHVVRRSDGGTDVVFCPETESVAVRVAARAGPGRLSGVRFAPVERFPDANAYFDLIAERADPGSYPKYFDALTPWTVVGLPRDEHEALVSETGAVEPVKAGYSLEPFIVRDGRIETWADASLEHSLEGGALPIPTVRWGLEGLSLEITAVADEGASGPRLLARYRVSNTGERDSALTLVLAARPFQVLPGAQFLNVVGGALEASAVEIDARSVRVDGRTFGVSQTPASGVVVADEPGGGLLARLSASGSRGSGPAYGTGQFPSGAWLYDLRLSPGGSHDVIISMPMAPSDAEPGPEVVDFDATLRARADAWAREIGPVDLILPPSQRALIDTLRANIAYILINADGPRIQPGSRTYERSWIRDGAMTSAALIATGQMDAARSFIEWYAPYQYENGKVPCVVDARGPDPVDENDAPGEFIFAIRNVAEFSGEADVAFARSMYPGVRTAVDYIESMRSKRLTPEYTEADDPILRACAGLMPESISHEGYSAKPMHSYWDDFWVYRGLWDAVWLAELLGESEDHARFFALAQGFSESLGESVRRAAAAHGIDYVPGCVELGDFDATSTAIALFPTDARRVIDRRLLESTFERAWAPTEHRMGGGEWDGMTPYEVRLIGTFVRLGWIDRAHAYLAWLMSLQDPRGWSQWGEIAYRADEPCRFVGDMPHTWVGSGAILAILSLFAYEDERRIVLAGGVESEWLETGDPVGVRGLVTRYGTLNYIMRSAGGVLELEILPGHAPPGGYVLDAGRLLPGTAPVMVVADRTRIEPDVRGVIVLPPDTRVITVTRSAASP